MFLISGQGQVESATDGFDKKDLLAIHQRLAQRLSVNPTPLFLPNERVPEFKPG
jgi:hypothetical protein